MNETAVPGVGHSLSLASQAMSTIDHLGVEGPDYGAWIPVQTRLLATAIRDFDLVYTMFVPRGADLVAARGRRGINKRS